jgi:hypothetical protein
MRWLSALLLSHGLFACERRYADDATVPLVPEPPPAVSAPATAKPRQDGIEVGPGKKLPDLQSVAPLLGPGDVVLLSGNASYRGGLRLGKDGAPGRPITIRGVTIDGKRPVIEGSVDTVEVTGDHYVFENIEITGASKRCFFHHSHDVLLKNVFIHDCKNGVLGADDDSGSLTIEDSELARSGDGIRHHQIYMATDEKAHPGSLFTLRHSFIHSGLGGNNVKSRAEKNLIVENWIEGAMYHEVELVGPDGEDPAVAREDGEVIGNVLVKKGDFHAVRIGGDGTGDTAGRYRFVSNTFIMAGSTGAIRLQDRVESIELYNNVFARTGGGPVRLFKDETIRLRQPLVIGNANWFPEGSDIEAGLTGTKQGKTPGFLDASSSDFRPGAASALVGAGVPDTPTNRSAPYDGALSRPAFEPPRKSVGTTLRARPASGPLSIGAFDP